MCDSSQVGFWVEANRRVRQSGKPNYLGERIRVPSKFNFSVLENMLSNYSIRRLIEFLKFGFPIEHNGSAVTHNRVNHKGAQQPFYNDIIEYLDTEIHEQAVLGPLEHPPFEGQVGISPLNSVPKKDSSKRRIILDLSFPEGTSVNDGIPVDWYQGEHSKLVFPTIDDLVNIIHRKGVGCLLFKQDIRRAYRWLPLDVGCIHLLGYMFMGLYFFDLVMPMGLCSAARCCQMLTDAITFVFFEEGYEAVNYIDDFGRAETAEQAWDAFYKLGSIIQKVGLTEAEDKASPPSAIMIFLGLEVNTIKMTIKIPYGKLEEIRLELSKWFLNRRVSKRQVQRLVGL